MSLDGIIFDLTAGVYFYFYNNNVVAEIRDSSRASIDKGRHYDHSTDGNFQFHIICL